MKSNLKENNPLHDRIIEKIINIIRKNPERKEINVGQYSFKKIDGFSKYFIGNNGDIVTTSFGVRKLIPKKNKYGYIRIRLFNDSGERMNCFIHRLVLEAYKDKSNLDVNHIDGNPENNYIRNLEYVSRRENIYHKHLLKNHLVGIKFSEKYNKWKSVIGINGKSKLIGYFDSKEKAILSYKNKLIELGIENKYAI